MTTLQQMASGQNNAEIVVNELIESLSAAGIFSKAHETTTGLMWGYYGGIYNGNTVADGTVTLTDDDDTWIVVERATGIVSATAGSDALYADPDYAALYKVTAVSGVVTAVSDLRMDDNGLLLGGAGSGGGGGITQTALAIACSDETTALTTGTNKARFINPFSSAFIVAEVVASLTTAQASGSIFTVDINEAGTSILSTKLTIDNTEKNSSTATAAAVISDTSIAAYAEISIDIDQVGDGTATGLKVYLIGAPA